MSPAPSKHPEHRWRRTCEKHGRPVKVTAGELLRDFGHTEIDADAGDDIEERLAHVGVHVRPPLAAVEFDTRITLELMMPTPGYKPSATSDFPALPALDLPAGVDRPLHEPDDPWSEDAPWFVGDPPHGAPLGIEDLGREIADDGMSWVEPDVGDEPDAWVETDASDEPEEPAARRPRAGDAPRSERLVADRQRPAPPVASQDAASRRTRASRGMHAQDRRLRLGAALAALAALALAGYAIGHDSGQPASPAPALTGPATHAGIGLRHPAGWQRRTAAPQIPGLRFASPLVIAPAGRSTAIVAGVVKDAIGSDLLPSGLRKRAPGDVPQPEAVLLGDIEALRYSRLRLAGHAHAVTLFGVPTRAGSVVIACSAPIEDSAFFGDCERSAATLEIGALPGRRPGAHALALGPSRSYARRVANAIAAVGDAIAGDVARLRRARTTSGQSTIARAIARSLSRAAAGLDSAQVSALDEEGHAALVAAIRVDAGAYDDLASAASDEDAGDYATASSAVRSADARLRNAIRALRELGYGD